MHLSWVGLRLVSKRLLGNGFVYRYDIKIKPLTKAVISSQVIKKRANEYRCTYPGVVQKRFKARAGQSVSNKTLLINKKAASN